MSLRSIRHPMMDLIASLSVNRSASVEGSEKDKRLSLRHLLLGLRQSNKPARKAEVLIQRNLAGA